MFIEMSLKKLMKTSGLSEVGHFPAFNEEN